MKKLVTLMLALSLGGSQAFAAHSHLRVPTKPAPLPPGEVAAETIFTRNTVLFTGFAAILCCLVSTGEDSFLGKVSRALEEFASGNPRTGIDTVVSHFVDPLKEKMVDASGSLHTACLTPNEVAAVRAQAHGYWDEEDALRIAGLEKTREESGKFSLLFGRLKEIIGIAQPEQQQNRVNQYIEQLKQAREAARVVQSTVGNP